MFPYFTSPRPTRPTSFSPFLDNHLHSNPPSYSIRPQHHSSDYPFHQSVSYGPPYHEAYEHELQRQARAQQLQRQRLERQRHLQRQAEFQSQLSGLQHPPKEYDTALKNERARCLAQAQANHRAQRQSTASHESRDPMVQVTLPDGRRCVVPLSWAKRMQTKHPQVLNDTMITKIRSPSPSPPPEHDLALVEEDETGSESHESEFYTLDQSQEPYPPVLQPSTIHNQSTTPPTPSFPSHRSRDELDEAARVIQKHLRLHLRLKQLKALRTKFLNLKEHFITPSLLELQFSDLPTSNSTPDLPSKLAYNTSSNRELQVYEDRLLKLQLQLDAIVSAGEKKIKEFRKQIVKEVETELERLDRLKIDAWNAQLQVACSKSSAKDVEVEMADAEALPAEDKIVTDVDSVKSESPSDEHSAQTSLFDDSSPDSPLMDEDMGDLDDHLVKSAVEPDPYDSITPQVVIGHSLPISTSAPALSEQSPSLSIP